MQLAFMMTARCNASCLHCSTSCGPTRKEHLRAEQIERLIQEAAELSKDEPLEISLTGGEPFLDFHLLQRVIAYGSSLGAQMTCVSNGYWATSREHAVALLEQLKAAGLKLLAISTSRFHQRFVPRARVDRALAAARSIDLDCVLKYVRTSADVDIEQIIAGASAAGAGATEILPLMPTLRDQARLPEDDFVRQPGIPAGTCPGAIINIGEDGQAYPCCTPGAINQHFAIGSIANMRLSDIQDRFYLDPHLQVLRILGPSAFADAVIARGLGHLLRPAYANVCDLCTHIASDAQMYDVANSVASDLAMASVEATLGVTT